MFKTSFQIKILTHSDDFKSYKSSLTFFHFNKRSKLFKSQFLNLTIVFDLYNFIRKYYINSIIYKSGYNPVNTATWLILLLISVILIYKFIRKRVKIDRKFVLSTLCYIIFGSFLRITEDSGIVKPPFSYLLMSPMIFFLVFALAFPLLLLSLKILKDNYWKLYSAIPAIGTLLIFLVLLCKLKPVNWWVAPLSFILAFASLCAYIILVNFLPKLNSMAEFLNKLAFFSGMLDAWASFIALSYFSYSEIHVIPRILVSMLGPYVLPIVKAVVFFFAIYVINKAVSDEHEANFLKLILIVFGLGPGLRNCLRVSFGV